MSAISISPGNTKMGSIPSVSLPSIVTCRQCDCQKKCYAHRVERRRPAVRDAYKRNFEVLIHDPDTYWREVEATVMLNRFFRFHVAGDIPHEDYLDHMVSIAKRNQHCQVLCFTKKFGIVNTYLNSVGGILPENLHIVFSGWAGLEMDNPYNLPEAHVLYNNGTTTAREDARPCPGNCVDCAITDSGCWVLKRGEQVVFHEH